MRYFNIFESKSAPLYHGTDLLLLAAIVQGNFLHKGINWGRPGEPNGPRLTRNYGTAYSFANDNEFGMGGVLVLDQMKIAQRYRIQPYADVDASGERWVNEFEEVPITSEIGPLNRYLISINADPAHIQTVMADEDLMGHRCAEASHCISETFATYEECHDALDHLLKHPMLNRMVPRGRDTPLGWRV
jgi:hypothetical protein